LQVRHAWFEKPVSYGNLTERRETRVKAEQPIAGKPNAQALALVQLREVAITLYQKGFASTPIGAARVARVAAGLVSAGPLASFLGARLVKKTCPASIAFELKAKRY
jgi:hypothetical protein